MALFGNQIEYETPASRNCDIFSGGDTKDFGDVHGDDDDDRSTERKLCEIVVQWKGGKPAAPTRVLVFAIHGYGAAFCQSATDVFGSKEIGCLRYTKDEARVGRVAICADVAFVMFEREIKSEDAPAAVLSLVPQLTKTLKSTSFIILDSLPFSKCYGREKDRSNLRIVATSAWKGSCVVCATLKAPSFLEAMSAALLSLFETSRAAAAAFVIPRMQHLYLDRTTLAHFEALLPLIFDDETVLKKVRASLEGGVAYRRALQKLEKADAAASTAHLYS
eukprot:g3338.t1